MPYDQQSGQFYTEVTVQVPWQSCKRHLSIFAPSASPIANTSHRTLSLRRIAERRLISHIDTLEAATIKAVPQQLLREIWRYIVRCNLATVQAWKLFHEVLQPPAQAVYDWRVVCQCKPLLYYIGILDSVHPSWITNLSLVGFGRTWTRGDLVALTGLSNLGKLCVMARDCELVDDRVCRAWAESAAGGAFTKFETLFVSYEADFTPIALQHLRRLPALHLICLLSCPGFRRKSRLLQDTGWREHHSHTERMDEMFSSKANDDLEISWQQFERVLASKTGDEAKHSRQETLALNAVLGPQTPTIRLSQTKQILYLERDAAAVELADPPATTISQSPKRKRRRITDEKQNSLRHMLEIM